MFANMIFDDFIEQAIDRPTRRRDKMQRLSAILVRFDRPFDRPDLASNPADAHEKRIALFGNMWHRIGT